MPSQDEPPPLSFSLDKPRRNGNPFESAATFIAYRRRRSELLASGLFDPKWYLQQYPDVGAAGIDPLRHFLDHGAYEGRSPGPYFDSKAYIMKNPDIATGQIEPWRHFVLHGKNEGRSADFSGPNDYAVRRDIAGAPLPLPLGRLAQSRRLAGHIDTLDVSGLRGWVFDPANSHARIEISLYVDAKLIARTVANDFREDILAVGLGDGYCGFNTSIPKRVYFSANQASVFARINGGEVLFAHVQIARDFNPTPRDRPTVHLDLSDLIVFMSAHTKVSGIQRVQLGLMDLVPRGYDLNFCGRSEFTNFADIPALEALALLRPTKRAERPKSDAWHNLLEITRSPQAETTDFRPDDVLLTTGAPWALAHHADVLRVLKSRGVRYFQVFYDIVPIAMPEVFPANYIPSFVASTASLVTHADRVYAISRFSKMELEVAAHRAGAPSPSCDVIRLGDTLAESAGGEDAQSVTAAAEDLRGWGIYGEFVLCVGTIEPRKNHALLYSVWRRLINEQDRVIPQLVLVGQLGWYMESFVRALQATDFLDRRIVLISEASDEFLRTLYQKCLFTVFPSFYEGWGLPIVESFANGKVCVCSSTTAMLEAGQDFAIYIDPENASGAFTTISGLIYDRGLLKDQEEKIRCRFKKTSWKTAAEEFSFKIEAAIHEFSEEKRVWKSSPLLTNHRYWFELPHPGQTARAQFAGQIVQSRLADVRYGPYWFDLESDCCWACGSLAVLCLECEPAAKGTLIEICMSPAHLGQRCEVRLDDESIGSFTLQANYGILHIGFETHALARAMRLELSIEAPPAPFSDQDKRLLGLGLQSLMIYDRDSATAFAAFLEAEKRGRNKDMQELMQNIIELSNVESSFPVAASRIKTHYVSASRLLKKGRA